MSYIATFNESGLIYLVSSMPDKTTQNIDNFTYDKTSSYGSFQPRVEVLVLNGVYIEYFYKYSSALLLDQVIYIKGETNHILRIETCPSKIKDKALHKYEIIMLGSNNYLEAPPGDCILAKVSPFYRTSMIGAQLDEK